MDGDELAAALFEQQGFLIAGDRKHGLPIGHIYKNAGYEQGSPVLKTPLRIIGLATAAEYQKQWELARLILGREPRSRGVLADDCFYRVEAAD